IPSYRWREDFIFAGDGSSSFAKAHHNLKAAGSNPAPATRIYQLYNYQQESPSHRGGPSCV
ncbi:hypothetical protein, partial [Rhizobium hidalgonense]|uniref:hypothetical protein n=1 Tax=Rhizobium hidalgonense TaxID=1538159 RepID=UPI002872571E